MSRSIRSAVSKNSRNEKSSGICELFHKTIKNEFYDTAFGKKIYRSLEALQTDLDHWLMKYNEHRPHSARHCYGKTPMQTFRETTHIALEKNIPVPDLSDSEALHSQAVR